MGPRSERSAHRGRLPGSVAIAERHYRYAPVIVDSYDVVYGRLRKDDVEFYVDLARVAAGRVLELGCGTGRILIPSAAAGARITGLDVSELMLDACRRKLGGLPPDAAARVALVTGDMTDFNLGSSFALITIPFRALSHLISVEDQLACLRCVKRHLDVGGTLVFDVFQPRMEFMTAPERAQETEDCPESSLPDGRTVRRTARAALHAAEQVMQIEFNYYIKESAGRIEHLQETFPFRYYFRYELEHLLARAGFDVAAVYGDFDRSPITDEPRQMIFVAQNAT